MKSYYLYMTADRHRGTIYTGVTSDLERRTSEHKSPANKGFTGKYRADNLVYLEKTSDVHAAIAREKQIKGWTRAKKVALIESVNPRWEDLSDMSFDPASPPDSFAKMHSSEHNLVGAQNDNTGG